MLEELWPKIISNTATTKENLKYLLETSLNQAKPNAIVIFYFFNEFIV